MRLEPILLEAMEMSVMSKFNYVLVDDEGNAIRFFDYQAAGTIKIVEPIFDITKCEEAPF